jgi:hypothetical protein
VAEFRNPAQTSSSSKNAGPFCELKKLKLFDLTGKDLLLFLTKMDALLPETKYRNSLSELLPKIK